MFTATISSPATPPLSLFTTLVTRLNLSMSVLEVVTVVTGTISSRHHLCILNKRIYSHKLLFNVVAARETSGQLDHLSSILQNYQMVDHVYMRMKEKPMCSFLSLHFYVARDKSIVYLYFSVNYK